MPAPAPKARATGLRLAAPWRVALHPDELLGAGAADVDALLMRCSMETVGEMDDHPFVKNKLVANELKSLQTVSK